MTVPYTFANASGNVPASELDANFAVVSAYSDTAGTVTAAAQGNITSVGTLSNLSVTGNVNAGNVIATNLSGPAFIATITSSQSIPASPDLPLAQLPITFNNIIKNIGNGYSAGIFTAPTAGFYQVSASFAPGVPSPPADPSPYYGAAALGIYVNNSPIASGSFIEAKARSWGAYNAWAIDASSVSTLVYLNIGDTLQCKLAYVTNYSGFTTLPNIIAPYFQACWIRGA